MEKEIIVGVTGASGMVYARRLLEIASREARVHMIISDCARQIAGLEDIDLDGFEAVYAENSNMAADVASGSFRVDGMAVVPCSTRSLAAIAHGLSDTLITRAADVCLKERRPCILLVREMPLSRIHLQNMLDVDRAGATVMVASPPFYHRPATIDDLVDMVVARLLDHLAIPHTLGTRWEGA
ncbi:MAG: UbiX family flavin prenyltransferase [Methanomicrobiales archaeon]